MVYQWKLPGIYKVSAQTAGEELDRIYQSRGKLLPADVVNESRGEAAPLHDCFEWDDPAAAEKYREHQARGIIRAVVVVKEEPEGKEKNDAEHTATVRAFVNTKIGQDYEPFFPVVLHNENKYQALTRTAMNEMQAFQRKFDILYDFRPNLRPVFDAIAVAIQAETDAQCKDSDDGG